MELADKAVGLLLTLISLSIFTYYTFWVIILVSSYSLIPFCTGLRNLSFIWRLIYIRCFVLSASCWQWSFRAQVFSPTRIRDSHSCICCSGAHLLLERVCWIRHAQVQEEEGMIWLRQVHFLSISLALLVLSSYCRLFTTFNLSLLTT